MRDLNVGPDADTWQILYPLSHLSSFGHSTLGSPHLWVGDSQGKGWRKHSMYNIYWHEDVHI